MKNNESSEGRSVRLLRVGEQVRHALSDVLMRGEVHDEVLASHSVSVTECGCRRTSATRRYS
jgi:ribosome-binding factor A